MSKKYTKALYHFPFDIVPNLLLGFASFCINFCHIDDFKLYFFNNIYFTLTFTVECFSAVLVNIRVTAEEGQWILRFLLMRNVAYSWCVWNMLNLIYNSNNMSKTDFLRSSYGMEQCEWHIYNFSFSILTHSPLM